MRVSHPWQCVCDENSLVLILGSFPSVKSRQEGFYYGNAQNIFWHILAQILNEHEPQTNEEKKALLLRRKIALWDVIESCEIDGSKDSSIKKSRAHDFGAILKQNPIRAVFTTGKKATELFEKLCAKELNISPIYLPSPSPANRAHHKNPEFWAQWRRILEFL